MFYSFFKHLYSPFGFSCADFLLFGVVYVSTPSMGKVVVARKQPISLYPGGGSRRSPVLLTYMVKSAHPVCDWKLACGPGGIRRAATGQQKGGLAGS
jgi:hypothetical protein